MRHMLLALALIFALLVHPPAIQAAPVGDWLKLDGVTNGAIRIAYDVKPGVKTKLMIEKGQDKYTYTLLPNKGEETFALQMGNGDYTVTVLEQMEGNKYKIVQEATVKLEVADSTKVYLNPIQNVNFTAANEAVKKAKELTATLATDREKVQAIYEYIINNIQYDEALAANVPADYIPDMDRTLAAKTDICYGYAALFAGMLRGIDIPAKLIMGTTEYVGAYHAWNEVYVNNQWVTIDTTVDAGWNGSGTAFQMEKDAAKYNPAKTY